MTDILPITKIPRRGLPGPALDVGDPDRAGAVAGTPTESVLIGGNREYRGYTGSWQGVSVVVSSHGTRAAFAPMVPSPPMRDHLAARVLAIDGDARLDHPDPAACDRHRRVVSDGIERGTPVALDALIALGGTR